MPRIIHIYWDYTPEGIYPLSYQEGLTHFRDITTFDTHCLEFFCFDNILKVKYDDVIIHKKNGEYISVLGLLSNDRVYTDKYMTLAHNIRKMLVAGVFEWRKDVESNEGRS